MQHIGDEPDEPNSPNVESYKAICSLVKRYMPEVRIIEATYIISQLESNIDVITPILDKFGSEYSYLKGLQDRGKEIWFYTCVSPQGNYANRFIQQPLIQTRLLHWINFKYGATGYLHWAVNFWNSVQDPYSETTNLDTNWPGGDSFIVYPGYQRLYASVRLHAVRDGIIDYELLEMLKQKDQEKARKLADALILSFDEYNNSSKAFRQIRKELLEQLSN
jgi:hypothetical protein